MTPQAEGGSSPRARTGIAGVVVTVVGLLLLLVGGVIKFQSWENLSVGGITLDLILIGIVVFVVGVIIMVLARRPYAPSDIG